MGRAPIEARPIAGFLDSPWQHIVNAKINHKFATTTIGAA